MAAESSIGTVVLDLMAGDATVEAPVADRMGDTAATMSVDTALLKIAADRVAEAPAIMVSAAIGALVVSDVSVYETVVFLL